MVDFQDDTRDGQGSGEPPDATRYAAEPQDGYEPHPLFPREDGGPEHRDIQFVSFRRRRSDGRIDNSAEDIPAGQLHSWAQVVGPWGGGEYKAIGKDKHHRVVAWYPEKNGEWTFFDMESKPFTLRDQRYAQSPPMAAPAAVLAPAVVAAPAAPIPPAAPSPPPASNRMETVMTEVLLELRELRSARSPAPAPAPAPATNDLVLVELIKSQGELLRTVLTQRPVEASSRPSPDPMAMALQILGAFQKFAPQPQPQASVTDRLGEYRAIRELTTPAAPPPPQSEFGEIKDLMMSVMQADALTKTTRDATMSPPVLERRPPPRPPPPPSPPPPSRAPLRHVPGVGIVEVLEPEGPPRRAEAPPLRTEAAPLRTEAAPLRSPDRAVDYARLLRDPAERQRLVAALGIESTASPAAPSTPAPLPEVPMLDVPMWNVPDVHAAIETAPEVDGVAASPTPDELFELAWDPTPEPERAPIEASIETPIVASIEAPIEATIAADEHPAIELPEHMPSAEPAATTEDERQRAQGSLARLAKMPRDQLRVVLSKLPGIGGNVDDTMRAVADLPPVAWPFLVANLPADVVRALAGEPGG